MASEDEHCADCIRELGEEFRYVHQWLDEFFPTKGYKHRAVRHHQVGVEIARNRWCDRAAKAAEIHIRKSQIVGFVFTGNGPIMKKRLTQKMIQDGLFKNYKDDSIGDFFGLLPYRIHKILVDNGFKSVTLKGDTYHYTKKWMEAHRMAKDIFDWMVSSSRSSVIQEMITKKKK